MIGDNTDGIYTMQLTLSDTCDAFITYPHSEYDNYWSNGWMLAKPMDWSNITINGIGEDIPGIKTKLSEGVEMKKLFEVWLVYAENRKKPIIMKKEGIIADNEEDAKIKSGLMKDVNDTWDTDYLNIICKEIADVKVKSKPKEVKNV